MKKAFPVLRFIPLPFLLLLILLITAPAAADAMARPESQLDDLLYDTIADAAGAVGGDFSISTSPGSAGARWDIAFPLMPDTIIYRHDMVVSLTQNPDTYLNGNASFYGMPAYIEDVGMNGSWIFWSPGKISGTEYYLEFHTEMATFRPTEGIDYLPASVMAEALHQAALDNGLYDLVQPGVEETAPPEQVIVEPTLEPETGIMIETEEPLPLPESPAEDPDGIETGPEVVVIPYGEEELPGDADSVEGTFEDAWQSREARGLRSPILPLLGGLIGVGVSLIAGQGATAGAVTARPVSAPPFIPPAAPPAVPPLPEAPPPLTAEELHTQEMRKQGMVYSDSAGWQTPEQARQSAAWQANDRVAVKAQDAAWRRDYEKERLDLQQNREEMEKAGKDLDAELKLTDLKLKMHQIQRELLAKHHYVFNPNQAIPVWDSITQFKNYAMDTVFRTKGLTCEGYVDETKMRIKQAVKEIYGEETVVETMKFDEKSSIMPRKGWFSPGAWKDWCDAFVDDNHVLTRITLPDKTELGADFHQYNARKRNEIIMPYEESRKVWKPYMGEHEFSETIFEKY